MKSDFFKTFIKYISIGILSFVIMLNFTSVSFISYADTQSDYDENNRQLDNLKKEQAALSSELGELNSQLETFSDTLNLITERMASKQQEIDILNQDISDMENEKHKQYEAMKLRIQYMYESSEYSFMDVLMDSADMAELLKKADYARQISDYDRSMLSNLNELITTLNQNKISLNNDMTELVSLKHQAVSQSDNIKNLIAAKQSKIDAASEGIKNAEALAFEYEKKLEEEAAARQLEEIKNLTKNDEVINNTPVNYDTSDLAMMAAIIECEAGNQSYEGKLAVGSVIVNRINSPKFGNTLQAVLYAPSQFSPVASGRFAIVLARGADAECTKAAKEVLNGHITINALYFHMYNSEVDKGGTIIGDHVFY
ncbi:MAG TPA: hypothetical protein DCE63_07670 [Eubacterium sp.]|nr:hypothetical protein [Eubacterium sp.]